MNFFLRYVCLGALALLFFPTTWLSAQTLKPVPSLVRHYRDQGVKFESASPFGPAAQLLDVAAARFARDAQLLTLDPSVLAHITTTRPEALTLQLPFHGQILTLDLIQSDPLSPDFSVSTSGSKGSSVAYQPGVHYRGVLRGDDESIAAFSFFEHDVAGIFSSPRGGNQVLGRLETPGNETTFVLYSENRLSQANPFECFTEDHGKAAPDQTEQLTPDVSGCVRVFFETDFALFQNKGSVQATVDYLSAVFNQLATLYANESISTKLSQVFVWTTQDPYSTSSSSTALTQFQSFRTSFNADIAHLVGIGGNGLGGIAYVDVLCFPAYSYAYSDIATSYSNVPTYSWTVEVLTHEMGHNLGSNHTQWCGWSGGALDNCYTTEGGCAPGPAPQNGGTIMSYCHLTNYGINFSNGFGSQPGNKVRTEVGAATCLAASCAPSNGCNPPTGITVSGLSGTNATISWTAVSGASSYSLQWRAVGASSWNTISNAVSPQALSGLPSADEVEVTIRSNCGANNSGYVNGVIFKTGVGDGGGGGGGGGTCNAPTNLSATATSSSAASCSWSAVSGASSYRISWKIASSSTWSGEVTVSGTAYNITGLAPSTNYNVRVRTVCGSTYSSYITTSFTTPASGGGGGGSCVTPSGLAAGNISYNKATISWNPSSGALSYDLQIKKSSNSNWTTFVGLPVIVVQVTGLQANTTYQVRVRAKCSGNTYSAYSSIVNFNTLAYLPGGNAGAATERSDLWQLQLSDSAGDNYMTLSPNPAQTTVTVAFGQAGGNTRVEVCDAFGKMLFSTRVESGQESTQLDISQLPAGLYLVRAWSDGQPGPVQKLVKQ